MCGETDSDSEEGAPLVPSNEISHRILKLRSRDHQLDSTKTDRQGGGVATTRPRPHSSNQTTSRMTEIMKGFIVLLLQIAGMAGFIFLCSQLRNAEQEVKALRRQLDALRPVADRMPNFALEAQGAKVLHHLSTDSRPNQGILEAIWDKFFCRESCKQQRRVIQGQSTLLPGQCWSFPGNQGQLTVSLSHPVTITHVTVGHITKSQAPSGKISSAPREFSIYGLRKGDEERVHLGTLTYDDDGAALQTFQLPNADQEVFRRVELRIENNWGNLNTCLYSFRVHGTLSEVSE